jgi:hypothetical protein
MQSRSTVKCTDYKCANTTIVVLILLSVTYTRNSLRATKKRFLVLKEQDNFVQNKSQIQVATVLTYLKYSFCV